eukprot:TRINITY_DN27629_c0_g1_i1.p1 TRINITY_DN27629_c0_g1~~TRINITY_DN27629_c0_g1_i1.p1  ORF type:complete len:113 (+),score=12.34 TRINITY_DN27629_c0_g1_i1:39-341(+)
MANSDSGTDTRMTKLLVLGSLFLVFAVLLGIMRARYFKHKSESQSKAPADPQPILPGGTHKRRAVKRGISMNILKVASDQGSSRLGQSGSEGSPGTPPAF